MPRQPKQENETNEPTSDSSWLVSRSAVEEPQDFVREYIILAPKTKTRQTVLSPSFPCSLFPVPSVLRHHQHFHSAGRILLVEHLLRGLLEILSFGVGDVGEDLRIAVRQRQPGTLHLHHDPATATKRVVEVGHREVDVCFFSR